MRIVSIATLGIVLFILVAGCSDKKNIIGEGSDLHPFFAEIRSDSLFLYHYSYEKETSNFVRNSKSLTGHFNDNESITLLRFANFPEEGFVLSEDSEAELTLQIVNPPEAHNIDGMVLKLGMIKQYWHHYQATWDYAEEETEWEESWDDYSAMLPLDEIGDFVVSSQDSSVVFTIPNDLMYDLIESWTMAEPEGFGMAVYSANEASPDSYIEFYSRETNNGPLLSFDYFAAENDTTTTRYERMPVHQTFINSKKPVEGHFLDELKIGNIVPTRNVVKLDLTEEFLRDFLDPLPEDGDLKKITVNKAELVLFRKENEDASHFAELMFEIFPYLIVNNEYPADDISGLPVQDEDIQIITQTVTSRILETEDSLAVNITQIIQAHVSELKPNKGFIISSSLENKDNSFIGFYPPGHPEEEKRPYLRIVYTLPFIP